jgi:hypothetical protein
MIRIDQEPDRVPPRPIRWTAVLVALAIAFSIGATILLAGASVVETTTIHTTRPEQIETTPFVLESEAERMRAEADLRLETYGWTDRTKGTIHVPLDIAIDQYLGARR